ncbi:putative leucine permease transcriptional regulator (SAC3) [Aspergillus melleus]|uniref:putative leucine permease transcriptional regulator (SAC3) n=1 Tax=Aspergillus melleus TaxID=138277 RepID=UPI001E8EB70B|nr:actin cytoskeleton and mitosis protein [Aspergillus melleus]KAH8433141.1 actin cytoskeleton and mitosis protein [Aspergillus melleus]
MAGPSNPFSAIKRGDAAAASRGRGSGRGRGGSSPPQAPLKDTNGSASRGDAKFRGRARGDRGARGNGRGGPGGIVRSVKTEPQQSKTQNSFGDKSKTHKKTSHPGQGRGKSGTPDGNMVDSSRDPRRRHQFKQANEKGATDVAMRDPGSYTDRYEQLKADRAQERKNAIESGQMADPSQPTSLTQAITPVGTCTSMCPEFERVERIVQKMVDKSEKFMDPKTNELQYMETMMLKRFRRSAAGYDEQLPSDIRTPHTLLQSMNYLTRHVVGGPEPLGLIHKFVWDRTRSIRNDFSVQQLTQANDVKIAVTCLERIARFHILSLHLLSSPANEEPFDHHQEREQLNNTMLSLMYYYDDNRERMFFPNEDEFRAYYIIFSILDQRPDLEARVQRWPIELRQSPRVQVALELHAAASNTWEPQGTLDAKRPNAIAQGFYTRFFNLISSPAVSYLMGCVAEIYFNHVRQTAIQSIWRGYCRQPASQRHKNEEWTVSELTDVLCFDEEEQTMEFCQEQSLEFAENENGELYLNWGNGPDDSDAFQPSSSHYFSETYVESKRRGRTLVAVILGLNIKEAAILNMIDTSLLETRAQALEYGDYRNEESLFVSDDDNDSIYPHEAALRSGARLDSPTSASSLQKNFDELLEPSAGGGTSTLTNQANSSHPASPFSAPFAQGNTPPTFNSPEFVIFPPQSGRGIRAEPSPVFGGHADIQSSSEPSASRPLDNTGKTPVSSPAAPLFENKLLQQVNTVEPDLSSHNLTLSASESNNSSGLTAGQSSSFLIGAKPSSISWGSNTPFTFPSQTSDAGDTGSNQPLQSTPSEPSQNNFFKPPAIPDGSKPTFTFPSQTSDSGTGRDDQQPQNVPPRPSQVNIFESSVPSGAAKPTFTFPSQTSVSGDTSTAQQSQDALSKRSQISFSQPPTLSGGVKPTFAFPSQTSNASNTSDALQPQNVAPKPLQINISEPPPTTSNPFAPKKPDDTPKFSFAPPTTNFPNAALSKHAGHPQSNIGPTINGGVNALPAAQHQASPRADETSQSRQTTITESSFASATSQASTNGEFPNGHQSYPPAPAASHDSSATEANNQAPVWLSSLREAAEKRRTSSGRKRVYNAEEETMDTGTKPPKVSKPELPPPPKRSLAQASVKPLPTLPILEQIEKLVARRPSADLQLEPPRRNQVDEDEMLLSAARIAAESLRGGPRLSDSFSTYSEPQRSFSPRSSLNSPFSLSRSQSPQSSFQVNGYDVALAPETDHGLGRSMSRTEQRIRATGGRGLAYKPLDFTPKKQRKTE